MAMHDVMHTWRLQLSRFSRRELFRNGGLLTWAACLTAGLRWRRTRPRRASISARTYTNPLACAPDQCAGNHYRHHRVSDPARSEDGHGLGLAPLCADR
jgi:hypothetical protein